MSFTDNRQLPVDEHRFEKLIRPLRSQSHDKIDFIALASPRVGEPINASPRFWDFAIRAWWLDQRNGEASALQVSFTQREAADLAQALDAYLAAIKKDMIHAGELRPAEEPTAEEGDDGEEEDAPPKKPYAFVVVRESDDKTKGLVVAKGRFGDASYDIYANSLADAFGMFADIAETRERSQRERSQKAEGGAEKPQEKQQDEPSVDTDGAE